MEQNIYLDKERLENSKLTTKSLGESLEIDSLKEKVVELNKKQMEPGFWEDNESAQKVISETNSYQRKIDQYDKLIDLITDAEDLIALMEIEEDYSSYSDFQEIVDEIEKDTAEFKLNTLLNGEYDSHNNIVRPKLSCLARSYNPLLVISIFNFSDAWSNCYKILAQIFLYLWHFKSRTNNAT